MARPEIRGTAGESRHGSSRRPWGRRRRCEPPQDSPCRLESPRGSDSQIGVPRRRVEPRGGSHGRARPASPCTAGESLHGRRVPARPASRGTAHRDEPGVDGAGMSHRRAHRAVSSHPGARTCKYGDRHVVLSHWAARVTSKSIRHRGGAHRDPTWTSTAGGNGQGLLGPPRPHGPTAPGAPRTPGPHGVSTAPRPRGRTNRRTHVCSGCYSAGREKPNASTRKPAQ